MSTRKDPPSNWAWIKWLRPYGEIKFHMNLLHENGNMYWWRDKESTPYWIIIHMLAESSAGLWNVISTFLLVGHHVMYEWFYRSGKKDNKWILGGTEKNKALWGIKTHMALPMPRQGNNKSSNLWDWVRYGGWKVPFFCY